MAEFPTKSPGEVVTAADWNQIEDYVESQPAPAAKMVASSSQSMLTGEIITLAFGSGDVSFDNDGMADPANNRLTVVTPGIYLVESGVRADFTSGSRITQQVRVNGTVVVTTLRAWEGGTDGATASTVVSVSAGDHITAVTFNTGSTQSTSPGFGMPFLSAVRLSGPPT